MNIGVFCSANSHIDSDFIEATRQLGQWLGREGHALVWGGCNLGLMETIGQAAHAAGATTIGVLPRIVERRGSVSDAVSVSISCEDLTDRKQIIMEHSDVFVALPGGIGTLDEIFTVAAMHTIGYHHKRLYLLNLKDFYRPVADLLDALSRQGMIRGQWQDYIELVDTLEDLQKKLA